MDYSLVGSSCEGQLYNAFASGLDRYRDQKAGFELLNKTNPSWSLEVVDFHNYIGVEIDRKQNTKKGVRELKSMMFDVPNITLYTPSNPMNMLAGMFKSKGAGKALVVDGLTLEIIAKVKTNCKLNPI